jgi:hypothetical protein
VAREGVRKIARGGETKAERHDGGVGSKNECDGEHDAAAAVQGIERNECDWGACSLCFRWVGG